MIKINGIDYGLLKIDKDVHRYHRVPVNGGENLYYDSVTTVLDKYKRPYNGKYWSLYKAYQGVLMDRLAIEFPNISQLQLEKRSKAIIKDNFMAYLVEEPYADTSENFEALKFAINSSRISEDEIEGKKLEVLESWKVKGDAARSKGNTYHRGRELNAIKNGTENNAFDNQAYSLDIPSLCKSYNYDPTGVDADLWTSPEEGLQWYMDYSNEKWAITDDPHRDLPDGFYPEFLVWDDDTLTCGTSDRVFIETVLGERFVDIDDYKTGNKIDSKSFYTKGKGFQMMQSPVSHMMDCKHCHYHLQVSIYAYMMEKMGFTVRNVGYHHLNTFNHLPYLKSEAQGILEDFNYNRESTKLINRNKL